MHFNTSSPQLIMHGLNYPYDADVILTSSVSPVVFEVEVYFH